ncbi:inositol polyphosphate multikinase-like [Liolophura sinensis]|uniref:inositol polyphosphate multikinase-like n=1 Tax=Liolophura sinensis TaxID=3198878 RepID=UPI003158C3B0
MTSADTALLPTMEKAWPDVGKSFPVNVGEENSGKFLSQQRRPKEEGECDIELPPGTVPLTNQVAGHRRGPGSMVMLKCEGGHVMKHVQPPPKGYREVDFYRKMFHVDMRDPVLLRLRQHIPAFYGTVPEGSVKTVKFFKMADVTQKFINPCVSDIKMGRVTYDPFATQEKRHYEIAKYPPGLNLGFQMLGMRVYREIEGKYDVYDRKYGRSLAENEVVEKGLAVFFSGQNGIRRDAVWCVLAKLHQIEAWFESQTQLAFYASSLLLMYEGNSQLRQCNCSSPMSTDTGVSNHESSQNSLTAMVNGESTCVADVKMIDFAHVFETTERDENYLFGLRRLIAHIERLL